MEVWHDTASIYKLNGYGGLMNTQPNIVFILSDQHNAKVLGHKGHANIKTPNLDRLAEEGIRFDNAITQNPICTPSRTCYLSGQYAHNHGIYQLNGPKPEGLPNMLGTFKAAGYRTAAIGKIHCPEYWVEDQCDVFYETAPGCSVGGANEYMAFIAEKGLVEEHQVSEGRKGPMGQCLDGYESPLDYRSTPEGFIVTKGIEFIRESRDQDRPFIAHLSFPRPHQTYAPTKEFWDMYAEDEIEMPPNWQWDMTNKAPHLIWTRQLVFDHVDKLSIDGSDDYEALCRRKMRGYLGNISMVDHAVGEILDYLDEAGIADNTIVVYSADHGDYACEHGVIEKAPGICSDAITRIPYIWRVPGISKAGHVSEELVETVDVYPTLCRLSGLDFPETADGVDITPLLEGGDEPLHTFSVTEFAWSKSMRKGDWRYVFYPQEMFADDYPEGFGELYNIATDPWEMKNLYFDTAFAEKRSEMERDLFDWLVTSTRVVGTNGIQNSDIPQAVTRYNVATNADGKISPRQLRRISYKNYL